MAAYRKALISFIDILGFRQIVGSRNCDEISTALKTMRQFSEGDDSGEEFNARVIQFSDSIIRIRPLDSKTNEDGGYGTLFHELLDIGMMQGELANNNIYIRGGVTIGDISYESGNIFGPGFIRAYDLESKIANYPRIVVDRKIFDAMKIDKRLYSSHNDLDDEIGYIARELKRGSDGIHFIDYLRVTLNNIDDPHIGGHFFLKQHKTNILGNIKSTSELDGETGKYLWAAMYHNQFLDSEIERNEDTLELWITEEELPLLETVLDRRV
ncbi:hypothetical protein FHR56_003123 [Xanthomonas sacchari]|uniref:hypothetical protein n=1 Tax=unclassified Xanthomonas TaxID=2643310 RepID=UPI00136E364C|nr:MULTISPECIES: hypothetical protein [unclassified Xanthomonas]MBB6367958.1 hypothetical protein [Xanthomonas sp. F10]